MKTMFSTALIAVLAIGFLMAASPGKAEAWYGGPAFNFSVVVPPFGFSVGTPAPYYAPAPAYAAPAYPVYGGAYYWPYYGYYGPYYRHGYWGHRGYWGGHGHARRY